MRIRINLDIRKPIQGEARIRRKVDDPSVVVDLNYERIPQFCFICGKIGHNDRFCSLHVQANGKPLEKPFGVGLRAPTRA